MSRIGLAAAAILLVAQPAFAATYEFRGFYAGAHAGHIMADADLAGGDLDGNSLMGGVQAGYNFMSGGLVYGLEIDLSLAGEGPDGICPAIATPCDLDMGPMGTLRARLGYAADDWLIYVTGGAAASQFELEDTAGFESDGGLHGWTVGAGIEYLLGDNVGAKVEYRHMQFGDFGSFDNEVEDQAGASFDVEMYVLMLGINFHF